MIVYYDSIVVPVAYDTIRIYFAYEKKQYRNSAIKSIYWIHRSISFKREIFLVWLTKKNLAILDPKLLDPNLLPIINNSRNVSHLYGLISTWNGVLKK